MIYECPYCGKELVNEFEPYNSGLMNDGDSTEFDCPFCGKTIRVTLSIEYYFDSIEEKKSKKW